MENKGLKIPGVKKYTLKFTTEDFYRAEKDHGLRVDVGHVLNPAVGDYTKYIIVGLARYGLDASMINDLIMPQIKGDRMAYLLTQIVPAIHRDLAVGQEDSQEDGNGGDDPDDGNPGGEYLGEA